MWRTGASAAGGLCSVTCCIWARSRFAELAWRKSIEAIEGRAPRARTLSLFREGLIDDGSIVRLKLKEMRLCRPRTFGSCWLALTLWRELQLDRFWKDRLPASREGTRWDEVLFVLVAYRLLSPGSEWRLHREWFDRSALADLLGSDASLGEINTLYRCHDRRLAHKQAVFDHLTGRWRSQLRGAALRSDETLTASSISCSKTVTPSEPYRILCADSPQTLPSSQRISNPSPDPLFWQAIHTAAR